MNQNKQIFAYFIKLITIYSLFVWAGMILVVHYSTNLNTINFIQHLLGYKIINPINALFGSLFSGTNFDLTSLINDKLNNLALNNDKFAKLDSIMEVPAFVYFGFFFFYDDKSKFYFF